MNQRTNRNNNIGTLHLIAAICVMYGHHCSILGQAIPTVFGHGIQAIGIRSIFVISGYLITRSLWSMEGKKGEIAYTYAVKRLGRLYPELIGCILFSALIIGPVFTVLSIPDYISNWSGIAQYIIRNLAMFPIFALPGVFANNIYPNAVNGSLWSLPVEIMLYFLILIVFLITKDKKKKRNCYTILTVTIIVSSFILRIFYPTVSLIIHGTDWVQGLMIAPYFLIGGMAYLYDFKKYICIQKASILMLLFTGGLVLSNSIAREAVCLIVLPYFVLALMLEENQKLVLEKICAESAYGIYLYGFVIQQCVSRVFFIDRNVTFIGFYASFVLSVVITYFIAVASYKLVYVPAHRIIKKFMYLPTKVK